MDPTTDSSQGASIYENQHINTYHNHPNAAYSQGHQYVSSPAYPQMSSSHGDANSSSPSPHPQVPWVPTPGHPSQFQHPTYGPQPIDTSSHDYSTVHGGQPMNANMNANMNGGQPMNANMNGGQPMNANMNGGQPMNANMNAHMNVNINGGQPMIANMNGGPPTIQRGQGGQSVPMNMHGAPPHANNYHTHQHMPGLNNFHTSTPNNKRTLPADFPDHSRRPASPQNHEKRIAALELEVKALRERFEATAQAPSEVSSSPESTPDKKRKQQNSDHNSAIKEAVAVALGIPMTKGTLPDFVEGHEKDPADDSRILYRPQWTQASHPQSVQFIRRVADLFISNNPNLVSQLPIDPANKDKELDINGLLTVVAVQKKAKEKFTYLAGKWKVAHDAKEKAKHEVRTRGTRVRGRKRGKMDSRKKVYTRVFAPKVKNAAARAEMLAVIKDIEVHSSDSSDDSDGTSTKNFFVKAAKWRAPLITEVFFALDLAAHNPKSNNVTRVRRPLDDPQTVCASVPKMKSRSVYSAKWLQDNADLASGLDVMASCEALVEDAFEHLVGKVLERDRAALQSLKDYNAGADADVEE